MRVQSNMARAASAAAGGQSHDGRCVVLFGTIYQWRWCPERLQWQLKSYSPPDMAARVRAAMEEEAV